jgi:hypothetical protein
MQGGYVLSRGFNQGKVCPAGYYCPQGTDEAIPCSEGNYCPTTGLATQIPCPVGSYSAEGATQCTQCMAPPNGTVDSSCQLQCNDGYTNLDWRCLPPFTLASLVNGVNMCPPCYSMSGTGCSLSPTCTPTCSNGYTFDRNVQDVYAMSGRAVHIERSMCHMWTQFDVDTRCTRMQVYPDIDDCQLDVRMVGRNQHVCDSVRPGLLSSDANDVWSVPPCTRTVRKAR